MNRINKKKEGSAGRNSLFNGHVQGALYNDGRWRNGCLFMLNGGGEMSGIQAAALEENSL
ncbi:hypothetical protein [Halobacillus kuroshimensis]|uniref:hypothetical protein n=1 Tax=Halobacillus kuroshimensis TaxID=302481 RepID=UPI0004899D0E|nr:hypothetical protein [Halobacillus kuroshimensis]